MQVSWFFVDWNEALRLFATGAIQKEWNGSQKWKKWVFEPSPTPPSDSANQFQDSMMIYEAILPHLELGKHPSVADSIGVVLAMKPIKDLKIELDSVFAIYSPERVRSMLHAYEQVDYSALAKLFDKQIQAGEYDSIPDAKEFCTYVDQWCHVLAQASAQSQGIFATVG